MGLEKYKDKVSESSNRGGGSKKKKDKKVEHDDSHEAYKIIWNGEYTLPMENNELVIKTKKEWNDIIAHMKNEMGISRKKFASFDNSRQFEVTKTALSNLGKIDVDVDTEIGECLVCNQSIDLDSDWDYEEYKEYPVCPTHTMGEVTDSYEESKRGRQWD